MGDKATREHQELEGEPVDRPPIGAGDEGTPEAGDPGPGDARPEDSGQPAPERDETPLQRAERERGEYLASWQRARADYKNLRRRTFEDIQAAVLRERRTLLEETLTVLDYLDMALAAPCESEEARNLLVGVRMTRDQLWAMLERHGVAPIPTDGAFDTERHQALATVESDEHEPGEIVEVVRRGFTIGEAVLRYAHVKVAARAGEQGSESEVEQESPRSDEEQGDPKEAS